MTILQKIISLIFLLLIFSVSTLFAYEVDIKADSLTYEQEYGVITASGNITLDWLGKVLQADNIEVTIPAKKLKADGNVSIKESSNTIFADSVEYSMEEEAGTISNSKGCSMPIFFKAEKMIKISSDTYEIENVTISNCDLDNPHHYVFAKKGVLVVDKKISVSKAIYYVGKIPVFYLPKYTRGLSGGDGKFSYEIEPGYINEGGLSLKTKLKYKFTKKFDGKLLLDYLGSIGEGAGLEFNYYDPKKIKASIFGYGALYRKDDSQRWSVQPSYWQRINDYWTVQAKGEFQSDSQFNNTYQLDNWNRTANTRKSYLSFTRQSSASNLRILSELYQLYDANDRIRPGSYLQLPQVYFSIYPKKKFGVTNNFTFNFENRTDYNIAISSDDFSYVLANADYNMTKDYKISKRFTLKPTLGIKEEFKSKKHYYEQDPIAVANYYGSLNARYRLASWIDFNFNYEARLRSSENSLMIDTDAVDKGFAKNALLFNNYMYLSSNLILRNYTGYDFRESDVVFADNGYKNWYPLISELTYVPSSKVTVYLRQQQDLDPFKFKNFQLDTKFGQIEKLYFTFGSFYYDYRPEEVDIVTGIGFWLNAKWRFDYTIRTTCKFTEIYFGGHDQEFKLYRDMHCFNLGGSIRVRDDYYETFLKFEMKTNVPTLIKKDGTKEIENEFYPWR